jgi:hypothetical protein
MGNLSSALQELRAERKQAQSHLATDATYIGGFTAQDDAGATGTMGKG